MTARRPRLLLAVLGTHTEVGKTWVGCALLREMRSRGLQVAARKPVQSYAANDPSTDADALAGATGERSTTVCAAARRYALPLAPPMAADALGAPRITAADLLTELHWPEGMDLGLVETVGGPRSPLAHDADSLEFAAQLHADVALLVADAGLGTLNAVRLSLAALQPRPFPQVVVHLNRFDTANDLDQRNRGWLREVDGVDATVDVPALAARLLRT